MRLTVKDVFFVHSKRAQWECTLVENASRLLARCGFNVWNYEDWDWQHETQDVKYSQSGIHLDMKRFLAGDPRPFRKVVRDEEVDMEELERIFKGTKVVVVLNPTGWPIGGVEDEIQALKWMGTRILKALFSYLEFHFSRIYLPSLAINSPRSTEKPIAARLSSNLFGHY